MKVDSQILNKQIKVLAITVKNNKDGIYYVWGLQDYDADAALIKPVVYVKAQ